MKTESLKETLFVAAILLMTSHVSAQVEFTQHTIVDGVATHWWARAHADINGDGLVDFFVITENASGGELCWYETVEGGEPSIRHLVAAAGPQGGEFAAGDLACGDVDNDGDIDVLGPVHTGEWDGSSEPTDLYWYEAPDWKPHYIGKYPSCIKDLDLVDLNADGKPDVAGTTFDAHRMIVYRQDFPEIWNKAADVFVPKLHEGQHVGDVDGDGDVDVVSTAFWFHNPGGDMRGDWKVTNIDPYWNSDSGKTWEYNATKIICKDIDRDGMDEVFISCSEKFRNRIAWYDLMDPMSDHWAMHKVGENTFAHTLQVGDVDGDGDFDVLSGNNADQGDPQDSPVILFLNQGDNLTFRSQVLTTEGAYNSYLEDVEGDGDFDIFRYDGHEGVDYELWLNEGTGE